MENIKKLLKTVGGYGNKKKYKETIEDLKQAYTIIQGESLIPLYRAFELDEEFSKVLKRKRLKKSQIIDKFKNSNTFTGYMFKNFPIENGYTNMTLDISIKEFDKLCGVFLSYQEKEKQKFEEIRKFINNYKL